MRADLPTDSLSSRAAEGAGGAASRWLTGASLAVLLLCVSSRCFLGELPYTTSLPQAGAAGQSGPVLGPDRSEVSRVAFAALAVLAATLWLAAGAIGGRLVVRGAWLAAPVAGFLAWSFISTLVAADKRAAVNAWLDQAGALVAALLAAQLFADRRRFTLLIVILVAAGAAMAMKAAWQVYFEIPTRIAQFEANRADWLRPFGWAEGTPQAALLEARVRERAPTGYFGLGNVFASLLLLLGGVAVGLAMEKVSAALGEHWSGEPQRKSGDIPPVWIAAALSIAVAAAVAFFLLLTHSRGAIAAGALSAVGGAVVWWRRRWFTVHWRAAVAAGAMAFVLAAGAVVAYGLRYDRLPTKTMTFRWYYWTASAGIVADRPLLGVGAGNFADAYLAHRRAAGEEEIKLPHNVIVHASSEFGLPGCALYLTVLGCFGVCAIRPRRQCAGGGGTASEGTRVGRDGESQRGYRGMWIFLVAGVIVARYLFAGLPGQDLAGEILGDVLLPAGALAVGLLMADWWGGAPARADRIARTAGGAALVAFFIHNMVSFSLWVPDTAMLFWVLAGACAARGCLRARELRLARWLAVIVGIAVLLAIVVLACRPVYRRTAFAEAASRTAASDPRAAVSLAERAMRADPLDPSSAAAAARYALAQPAADREALCIHAGEAWRLMGAAIRRDSARFTYHRFAAELADMLASSETCSKLAGMPSVEEALAMMKRAVELNPMDARLRIDHAAMLLNAGRRAECMEQLDAAEGVNDQLYPGSLRKLSAAELGRVRSMREQAERSATRSAPAEN